ncbi:MAG: rod shape-determining protein MreD [Limnochordia bacterium]
MPAVRVLCVIIGAMLLGVLMQSTVLAAWAPRFRLDLVTAMATAFGLVAGPLAGGVAGLVGGLLGDMLTGRLVGLGMLTHAVVGLLSGLLGRRLFSENLLVPFGAGALLTCLEQTFYLLGAKAFGVVIPFGKSLAHFVLPSLWYNGVLTALCFMLVHKASNHLTSSE